MQSFWQLATFWLAFEPCEILHETTIPLLALFYNVSTPVASLVYNSLWQPNGLYTSFAWDEAALNGTEAIFQSDTGTAVPQDRAWVNTDFTTALG